MSVQFSNFTITAPNGCFYYSLISCNPNQPVSFELTKDCPSISGFVGAGFSGKYPSIVHLSVKSNNTEPTVWDQNPIKIVLSRVPPDRAEFSGETAVLYGYFLKPYAQGLGFYLNSSSGINITIENNVITAR